MARLRRWAWLGALLGVVFSGCGETTTDAQLDEWLEEARAANAERRAAQPVAEPAPWTLEVIGEVERPETLDWSTILSLPAESFEGPPHADQADGAAPDVRWRGTRISTVLERVGVMAGVEEVTLVAFDGFRATLSVEDLRRFPILLAYEANGQPLPRERGGPLYSVLPVREHPELAQRYDARWWVFYVTHLLVGSPDVEVQVGSRTIDASAFAALPQTSVSTTVGYRVGWPSEPVTLRGVRLEEVLRSASAELVHGARVRVQGLAPISRQPERPTLLSTEEIAASDVMLATHWGEPLAPISARLGGPVVLVLPQGVGEGHPSHDWLTFVTSLEVMAP